MGKRISAVTLALLLLLSACALKTERRRAEPDNGAGAGSSLSPGQGQDGSSPRRSPTPAATSSTTPTDRPSPGASPPPDSIAMTAIPDPRCADPGAPMTIEIQAEPEVGLSMVVGYSDDQAHGNYNFGDTDASGRYLWAFVISPEAPRGKATVAVVGRKYDGSKGGHAIAEFQVGRCG